MKNMVKIIVPFAAFVLIAVFILAYGVHRKQSAREGREDTATWASEICNISPVDFAGKDPGERTSLLDRARQARTALSEDSGTHEELLASLHSWIASGEAIQKRLTTEEDRLTKLRDLLDYRFPASPQQQLPAPDITRLTQAADEAAAIGGAVWVVAGTRRVDISQALRSQVGAVRTLAAAARREVTDREDAYVAFVGAVRKRLSDRRSPLTAYEAMALEGRLGKWIGHAQECPTKKSALEALRKNISAILPTLHDRDALAGALRKLITKLRGSPPERQAALKDFDAILADARRRGGEGLTDLIKEAQQARNAASTLSQAQRLELMQNIIEQIGGLDKAPSTERAFRASSIRSDIARLEPTDKACAAFLQQTLADRTDGPSGTSAAQKLVQTIISGLKQLASTMPKPGSYVSSSRRRAIEKVKLETSIAIGKLAKTDSASAGFFGKLLADQIRGQGSEKQTQVTAIIADLLKLAQMTPKTGATPSYTFRRAMTQLRYKIQTAIAELAKTDSSSAAFLAQALNSRPGGSSTDTTRNALVGQIVSCFQYLIRYKPQPGRTASYSYRSTLRRAQQQVTKLAAVDSTLAAQFNVLLANLNGGTPVTPATPVASGSWGSILSSAKTLESVVTYWTNYARGSSSSVDSKMLATFKEGIDSQVRLINLLQNRAKAASQKGPTSANYLSMLSNMEQLEKAVSRWQTKTTARDRKKRLKKPTGLFGPTPTDMNSRMLAQFDSAIQQHVRLLKSLQAKPKA